MIIMADDIEPYRETFWFPKVAEGPAGRVV